MRHRLLVTLLSVTVFVATNAIAVESKEAREAELRARLDAFAAAWNNHDAKEMSEIWAADGDLINPFGRMAHGRAEIEKLFQDEHSGALKHSTFKITNSSIRFLESEIAVVDSDAEITGIVNPDGTPGPTMNPHLTAVMKKSAGKWWMISGRAFSYLRPSSPPAAK